MANSYDSWVGVTYCRGCRQPIPIDSKVCPYCGCKPSKGLVFHIDPEDNVDTEEIALLVKNAAAGMRKIAEKATVDAA